MKLSQAIHDVKEWNERFGHLTGDKNERREFWEDHYKHRKLAVDLVLEEVGELARAIEGEVTPCSIVPEYTRESQIELLDAICDILVTTFGVAAKAGLEDVVEEAFEEVMESNWSKLDASGNPVYYDNGKIAKSDLYRAPDLSQFV